MNKFLLMVAILLISACAGIGYYDEELCADGSKKRRHKPRHGPSIFTCPEDEEGKRGMSEEIAISLNKKFSNVDPRLRGGDG